jgi:beta-lactamase superfamily II metal-dependent hydrolase
MQLQIFDVEHGACSLLTADNNARLMIDCGHNSTTGWKPGTYLRQGQISRLEMLAITNYDEDHVSGCNDLLDNVFVQWLWRNQSVSASTLSRLKSENGMGPGITRLAYAIDHVFTGDRSSPHPVFQGLAERTAFWNSYPAFDDENNLSMAIFLKCHNVGVMFTGDLERLGFTELLKNADFRRALLSTNIYIASHHGRESGCSADVARLLTNVYYVVISDKGYEHETQNTLAFYQKISRGGAFGRENRRVLTTRRDGRILFQFSHQGWGPIA